jgi:hypothetical protein
MIVFSNDNRAMSVYWLNSTTVLAQAREFRGSNGYSSNNREGSLRYAPQYSDNAGRFIGDQDPLNLFRYFFDVLPTETGN